MITDAYFACSSCSWHGTLEEVEKPEGGECCPECGDEVEYDETEEFAESGHLCLACGNADENLFEGEECLNGMINKYNSTKNEQN